MRSQSNGGEHQSRIASPSPAPNDVDLLAAVSAIPTLKAQYDEHIRAAEEIRETIKRTFAMVNGLQPEFITPQASTKTGPQNPRPDSDKLHISAGRKILEGLKKRWPVEKSREEAILAATTVAKKYGHESLPTSVVAWIDNRIKIKYNLY